MPVSPREFFAINWLRYVRDMRKIDGNILEYYIFDEFSQKLIYFKINIIVYVYKKRRQ